MNPKGHRGVAAMVAHSQQGSGKAGKTLKGQDGSAKADGAGWHEAERGAGQVSIPVGAVGTSGRGVQLELKVRATQDTVSSYCFQFCLPFYDL